MSFETAEILRKRAESFLKNAEELVSKGVYDLAAFNVHQFVEIYLKYKLYVLIGDYPKTHSIKKLLRDIGAAVGKSDEIRKLLENNIDRIGYLEAVYLTSRYIPVEFEKIEVENLIKTAKEIKRVVDELCSN